MRLIRTFAFTWTRVVSMKFVPYARRVKSAKLICTIFQPGCSANGIWAPKQLTRVFDWKFDSRKRRKQFVSSNTWISNEKYLFRFFSEMMKNGNLMANDSCGFAGAVMNVVVTFRLVSSRADELMSSSVRRLQMPLSQTLVCQMANGFEPTILNMLKKPCWKEFRNILAAARRSSKIFKSITRV